MSKELGYDDSLNVDKEQVQSILILDTHSSHATNKVKSYIKLQYSLQLSTSKAKLPKFQPRKDETRLCL
jgi:hypothetical protein